jgi:site-specific recombinase XerD
MLADNGTFPAITEQETTDLTVPTTSPTGLTTLGELVDKARTFAASAKSPATRKAYRMDWSAFEAWCQDAGLTALPASPATVATYATYMIDEGLAVSTVQRAMVSISQGHKMARHRSPTSDAIVLETLKGIRRQLGTAQRRKRPLLPTQIRTMLDLLPESLLGVRDRAILLLGFAGGFRRSELVGLDVSDIEFTEDGMVVTVKKSKTDQEGKGRRVGIPYGTSPSTCPARCTKAWIDAASITSGPVFRPVGRWGHVAEQRLADRAVARVVQRYAQAVGFDAGRFGGHSLRAGLATAAARAGRSERSIMNQTGHRSVTMVRKYIREGSLFTENAAAGLL